MRPIEEIIKAIDDKLIEDGKVYLSLAQANQLLVTKDIITISEQSTKVLKKLLEENKIPHAYKTNSTPNQWRIPFSEEGKLRKESIDKKTKSSSHTQESSREDTLLQAICPHCGLLLSVPLEIINETYLQCLICGENFRNPLKKSQTFLGKNFTSNQINWFIVASILVIVSIIFILTYKGGNSSSSYPSSLYSINTQTYAATSMEYFNEMYSYINDRDEIALASMLLNGSIKKLFPASEVHLVDSHFGYAVVRLRGSTEKLWVPTESLTRLKK